MPPLPGPIVTVFRRALKVAGSLGPPLLEGFPEPSEALVASARRLCSAAMAEAPDARLQIVDDALRAVQEAISVCADELDVSRLLQAGASLGAADEWLFFVEPGDFDQLKKASLARSMSFKRKDSLAPWVKAFQPVLEDAGHCDPTLTLGRAVKLAKEWIAEQKDGGSPLRFPKEDDGIRKGVRRLDDQIRVLGGRQRGKIVE